MRRWLSRMPLVHPSIPLLTHEPKDLHRPVNRREIGRLVQPSADAGGMRQGDEKNAVANRGSAHDGCQRGDWTEEGADRQQADQEHDFRLDHHDEIVEPRAAEGLFLGRWDAVAFGSRHSPGVAAGDRGEVDLAPELVARDAGLLQPVAQLVAGGSRERAIFKRGAQAGGLADEENSRQRRVGLGVADDRDRLALVEEPGQVALAAGPEAGVQGDEAGASERERTLRDTFGLIFIAAWFSREPAWSRSQRARA